MAEAYDMESLLTDEERGWRDRVRDFAREECLPLIAGHFDAGTFPAALIPRMAELGLFALQTGSPGCRPASHTIYGLVCRELGWCDSGIRALVSVQGSLVMHPISAFGSDEQKKRWLPGLSRGEVIGCFGLTEPDFGSNPAGMACRAERREGGFVINGAKMWITNGPIASLAVIWARLEGEIRGFLVETRTPGFRAVAIEKKFSYRTSPTAAITLKDCHVPDGSILPRARGLKPILSCLDLARYGVASSALGSAAACYEAALGFARKREAFGKPIASFQLVQEKLVRMALEIAKAELLTHHLGRLLDKGRARPAEISMAKLNNVREAMAIARDARDILGARGILADNAVIRHLCDLEAMSTLEGTDSIQTLIIGQDLTGIQAFH